MNSPAAAAAATSASTAPATLNAPGTVPVIVTAPEPSGLSGFISKHKVTIAVFSALAIGATGYYFYSNNIGAEEKPKKKKKKKSKARKVYPVDEHGMPVITDEYVKSLSESQKDSVSLALKEAGNVFFKNKDQKNAIELYTAALKVKPTEVYYANRSACYAALENQEKVIEDTTAALKMKPDYGKCLLRRAAAYEKLGRYDDAMFDLTALTFQSGEFGQDSINKLLERNLKQLSERKVNEQEANTVPDLPSAVLVSSFFTGFDSDEKLVKEINAKSPKEGSALFFLAKLIENMELKTEEAFSLADSYSNQAINAFGDIKADDPDAKYASIAYEYAGAFSFLKSQETKSVEYLDKALSLQPRARAYVLKALTTTTGGGNADSYFETAMKLEPTNDEVYYQVGQHAFLFGDSSKAREYFEKSKELNPKNIYALIQLSCMAHTEGKYDEAIKIFKDSKKQFPLSPEIPNYFGEILAAQNKIDEALEQFEISYKLQKANKKITVGVLPLIHLATIYAGKEDLAKACEYFEKAVAEDPKSEDAFVSLGQIRLQQNEVEEAIKLFEHASKLSRTKEGKINSMSYAEAAKMQLRVSKDEFMNKKMNEILAANMRRA